MKNTTKIYLSKQGFKELKKKIAKLEHEQKMLEMELRDGEVARGEHLGIVIRDCRRHDDRVRAAHVLRLLPAERYLRAKLLQLLDDFRALTIRARHVIAELEHHLRERAHACAADPDEMEFLYSL